MSKKFLRVKLPLSNFLPVFLFTIVLSVYISNAQVANNYQIKVGPNLLIPAINKSAPIVEPHLAINPSNPSEMIVAAIIIDSPSVDLFNGSHTDLFYTSDSGTTWKQTSFPMIGGADPSVSIDANGNALFAYLGEKAGKGFHLFYHSSTNAGKTWSDSAISLGTGHDLETLVTDKRNNGSSITYLASAIYFKPKSHLYVAKSEDGKIIKEVYRLSPNNLEFNAFNPVILADGSLVIPFIDYSGNYKLKTRRTWLLVGNNSATTFEEPRFAFDNISRSHLRLAADLSGRYAANRLYSTRIVPENDSINFVSLNVSDNKGIKWTSDLRIDKLVTKKQNPRTVNVAVTESGIVGVAWFDNKTANRPELIDLYFTASIDGGKTFLPEVKVTAVSTNPNTEGNGKTPQRFPTGGD